MATKSTYLARDPRSGLHCLVRLVRADDLGRKYEPVGPEGLNALLMARDAGALVGAADVLGPMWSHGNGVPCPKGLLFRPSELQGPGRRALELRCPDPGRLLTECFFDPFSSGPENGGGGFTETGKPRVAATRRAAKEFDFLSAPSYEFADDAYRLLIEPLGDWVFARNVLSVLLRLAGIYRTTRDESRLLERAGFRVARPRGCHMKQMMGGDCFVIPIGYNPFYREGSIVWNSFRYDSDVIWPLYSSLVERGVSP